VARSVVFTSVLFWGCVDRVVETGSAYGFVIGTDVPPEILPTSDALI